PLCGGTTPPLILLLNEPGRLNRHQVLFLRLQHLLDFSDVFVGKLLNFILPTMLIVFADFLFLHQLVDHVIVIATRVTNRHPTVLGISLRLLDHFLSGFFSQHRHGHPDDVATGGWIQAQVRRHNRFFNRGYQILFPGRNRQRPVVFHVHAGHLLQRCFLTVVVHHYAVQDRRMGTSGTAFIESRVQSSQALFHLLFGFSFDVVNHVSFLNSFVWFHAGSRHISGR